MVTLRRYLQENGTGAFRTFRVPDLCPQKSQVIELLIILESPHADEIAQGFPVSGQAGKDALRFLKAPVSTTHALGPFVASIHATGDGRVAIMNVSEVPLQKAAFAHQASPPGVALADWDLLARVRNRKAKSVDAIRDISTRDVHALLLPAFQARLDALHFSASATVVPAGGFAQRFWNSISVAPNVSMLQVPHPSRRLWDRASGQNFRNLQRLRTSFAEYTS